MAAGAGEGAGAAVARCCCCFEACCCDAFFFVDAARDGELPRRVLLDRRMAVPPPPAERSSTRLALLDSLFLPPFCARSPKFGWGGSLRLGNLKKSCRGACGERERCSHPSFHTWARMMDATLAA